MMKVPRVTDRSITIADMQLIGSRYYPFCNSMRVGYHNVVARNVELLNRKRHERKHFAVVMPNARKRLQKTGLHTAAPQPFPEWLRHNIQQAEKICVREQ